MERENQPGDEEWGLGGDGGARQRPREMGIGRMVVCSASKPIQPASQRPVAFCSWSSSAMWVRSVLPPVPPCQRSAPGVESKATTLPPHHRC